MNFSRNSWEIPVGLSEKIRGASHVAYFLVVTLGEFLDEILEESLEVFESCRTPGAMPDEK